MIVGKTMDQSPYIVNYIITQSSDDEQKSINQEKSGFQWRMVWIIDSYGASVLSVTLGWIQIHDFWHRKQVSFPLSTWSCLSFLLEVVDHWVITINWKEITYCRQRWCQSLIFCQITWTSSQQSLCCSTTYLYFILYISSQSCCFFFPVSCRVVNKQIKWSK